MNTNTAEVHNEPIVEPLGQFPPTLNLYDWMLDEVYSYFHRPIMEINSGNADVLSWFSRKQLPLHLSHPNKKYCESLRNKYGENPIVHSVHSLDPDLTEFEYAYSNRIGFFKTILAINTKDYITFNSQNISKIKLLISENGRIIFLTPARTTLYCTSGEDSVSLRSANWDHLTNLIGTDMQIQKIRHLVIPNLTNSATRQHTGLSSLIVAKKISEHQ